MPASWSPEAVKAQAVAARSYAYRSRRSGDFDVYCTTQSQVYAGYRGEAAASDAAIAATAGQVVKYGSSIAQTFFHSTSGGHTEDNENVWKGGEPQPYLRGVPDPYEASAGSKYHVWPEDEVFDSITLRAKLAGKGISVPTAIVGIDVTERGVSGRVTELVLRGAEGDDKTVTDIYTVRSALGLRDTWFYLWFKTSAIYGDDRYLTAVQISRKAFDSADAVIVTNGGAFADALSASALAGSIPGGAPILLTTPDSLPMSVVEEIRRLGAEKAYIVGGEGVVSGEVAAALGHYVGDVERLAGPDRFATSAAVAGELVEVAGGKEALQNPGDVLVVNGFGEPDAVAASALAYAERMPVVMTRDTDVPPATRQALDVLGAQRGITVGGKAVVPDARVADMGLDMVRAADGTDRYDTAVRFADFVTERYGFGWTTPYVASGETLVDALSGGPLAGGDRSAILFARAASAPTPTVSALSRHKAATDLCYLLGGPGAIGDDARKTIDSALQ